MPNNMQVVYKIRNIQTGDFLDGRYSAEQAESHLATLADWRQYEIVGIPMRYKLQDREAGNLIDTFGTLEEAEAALERYEEEDRRDGDYTPNFYEIAEIEID